MKKIVIATKNEGKLREMKEAFAGLDVEILPLKNFGDLPDATENGETFADNALIKAEFFAEKTNCACLADDSGLCVEALGGAPGVLSARFAGWHADDAANNKKLIAELGRVNTESSAAAYRCALAFADTDGTKIFAEGSCEGIVTKIPRGENGFGYDPYFYVGEKSMAEMTFAEKDKISHRGKALREMAKKLEAYLK